MFSASCRDLGVRDCEFVGTAESVKKLENVMLEHARDEHPQLIAGISEEQHEAMLKQIAEAARETTT